MNWVSLLGLAQFWNDLAIGILSSLIAAAIVAAIPWLRRMPSIPVPTWALAGVLAFVVISLLSRPRTPSLGGQPLEPVVGKQFQSQTVVLDGKQFIRCEFDRCTLVYNGTANFAVERCQFAAPLLKFEGYASVTAYQLAALNEDPIFRPSIERLLNRKTYAPLKPE